MKKLCLTILLFGVCCAVWAQGYVVVGVSIDGLSPDPVNIVTGEAVFWTDADGGGPYNIFGSGWSTVTDGFGIQFIQAGQYLYSDDMGDQGTINVAVNIPPSVTITNPLPNAVLTAPATFLFGANASDTDVDGIWDVQFMVGTNLVDDVASSPYVTTVTDLAAGNYALTVIATDGGGATATNSINITVQNAGGGITLTAPTISGGQFQFGATGLTDGKTNILQATTNLVSGTDWVSLSTNVAAGSSASFSSPVIPGRQFFRLLQLP